MGTETRKVKSVKQELVELNKKFDVAAYNLFFELKNNLVKVKD